MTNLIRAAALSAMLVAIAIATAWIPATAEARGDDPLPALLVEVRGLRTAMELMASGATQAHVLVGRLQLQETRIAAMTHRLDTVRDNLASARAEHDMMRDTLKLQEKLEKAEESRALPDVDLDYGLPGLKMQVAAAKANVDRLSAEEIQLTGDIAVEQQRWIDINQRLDELQRVLAKR